MIKVRQQRTDAVPATAVHDHVHSAVFVAL
jgi:hypothetical protein